MVVVYFIVLVGVLIFVHELGHFIWAKFFGVKVLKFSLGFGPKIAGFTRGGTEYVIAAFPLGGYVRMLGESPYDPVETQGEERSFAQQPLWKRVIIVIAGPAMNLLLPIALFFVVCLGETEMPPAVIGTVYPGQPADGVLQPGDRVLSVEGEQIATFYELRRIIHAHPNQQLQLVIERDGHRRRVRLTPALAHAPRPLERSEPVGRVGIMPHHPLAIVGVTSPASPAATARLRTFDRIIGAANRPIERWIDFERVLHENGGRDFKVTYLRPTRVPEALGGLAELEVYDPHIIDTLTPESGPGDVLVRAGLEPADLYVANVTVPAGPRDAHLMRGDRLVTLDGRPIILWATMLEDVEAQPERMHELTWRRNDQLVTRRYRLRASRAVSGDEYDERLTILSPDGRRELATISQMRPTVLDARVSIPHPVLYATGEAFRITAELVELTVYSIVRLLQGRLSVRNVGGFLTVFEATAVASREGPLNYLSLMALISINLGLINLLPIPMLDGGHLLFFLVEAVARRPISVRLREYASLVGLVMIVLLLVLAFVNDIGRQWPSIVETFQSE